MSYDSYSNFSELKKKIIRKASDQIATCKSKLDKRQCTSEKCKHCEYGNIIKNLGMDFTEEEILYIYSLAKMKYTKGKIEELEEKDKIKKQKRRYVNDQIPQIIIGIIVLVLYIFGIIALICYL